MQSFNMWRQNSRTLVFWSRFYAYSAMFQYHFRIPRHFNFMKPGLEIKFALEEAERCGAKQYYLGAEFDQKTWGRLLHETRMNIPHYLWKRFVYSGHKFYNTENHEIKIRMNNSEPSQFTEKCLDQHLINWYIQNMDIFFPKFKSIFIDRRDEDIFRQIDSCKEQRVVAVVNQWHMEGIEHEWAHRYGQLPRSVHFPEGINPIGDMDLRNGLFQRLYNALHREIAAAKIGGTPVTYADWIIGYHREANF
jgi:pheromone shutdown protein TraB